MQLSNIPIIKHITDYLEYLEIERGSASKTQENYARYLNKFVKWLKTTKNDGLKPHELTPDHIWQYRIFMARSPISETNKKTLCKKTQNFYLIALRSLLTFFSDRDIQALPADKIKLAKRDRSEQTIKFLNLDQIEKLLLAPDTSHNIGLRDRAILEVLFSTGMRIAELVALDKNQIKVKPETKDLELSITGKGNHTRTIYFSDRSVRWLKKYLDTRNDDDKALFINYKKRKTDDQSPIRLTVRSIERMVEKYSKMAGLPIKVTPHVLRHTLATDLLNQGADLRVVQEILGHQSVATTQIYTHVTNKRLRDIHRQFHSGKKLKE
ncbi:MAG TPA: tyrosine-type recombinase/integrase [Candidatus Paceibacterota bacterium]|nr:tyrosine-type recombinase/integrase [Candidatus Paceibacterota bacterium]